MGALYVTDEEAFRSVTELAERRGLSNVAAAKLAPGYQLAQDIPSAPQRSVHEIVAELQRTSPHTYDPTIMIDKTFWDSLYDDDE